MGSTFVDTFIHLPCFFFPQFYLFQSLVYEKRLSLSKSIQRWKDNFTEDFRNCLIWVPLDLLMFAYIPLHLRTPFVASAGLIWPILMSLQARFERILEECAVIFIYCRRRKTVEKKVL